MTRMHVHLLQHLHLHFASFALACTLTAFVVRIRLEHLSLSLVSRNVDSHAHSDACLPFLYISFLQRLSRRRWPRLRAWKPARMDVTAGEAPQLLQLTKYNRLTWSRFNKVSGDRHISQVTYSVIYFLNRLSIFFGTKRPFNIRRLLPSIEPSLPSSAWTR